MSLPANIIEAQYGINPLWMLLLLMIGFAVSCCLMLHWRIRVWGMLPLVAVAITTIWIYSRFPIDRVFTVVWIYGMIVLFPIGLVSSMGDNADWREENERLKREQDHLLAFIDDQNRQLIEYESRFTVGSK